MKSLIPWFFCLLACAWGAPVRAAAPVAEAAPDLVVIVDTSKSMSRPGMDRERSSLLVAKLLSDIVPGDLAVVQVLDLTRDAALLPRRETSQENSCSEDANNRCHLVEPTTDWAADARRGRFGLEARPERGDPAYKQRLDAHLAQTSNNSLFFLSFRAAQGLFDEHDAAGKPGTNRTVVWLSDGKDEQVEALTPAVNELRQAGVDIRAMVFGRGDPAIAQRLNLPVDRVNSPADLMRSFAQVFRRLVHAPYRVDNLVAKAPDLDVRPNVEELWVVVYGDDTLGEVSLTGPGGEVRADYAADRQPGAGAYRVAHVTDPAAGVWRIHARGGGAGLAYALVQRSSLTPALLEPRSARAQERVRLVAAVRAGRAAQPVADAQALEGARIVATIEGQEVALHDDGQDGDEHAGDGLFSAWYRFNRTGAVPVGLHLTSPVADRRATAEVAVAGVFRYTGGPLTLDLGRITAPGRACRALSPVVEHHGEMPFVLEALRPVPAGHGLLLHAGPTLLTPGGGVRPWKAGDALETCLEVTTAAASNQALGEPWLRLAVDGSDRPDQRLEIALRWEVVGLSFWQRWGWLILSLLALAVAVFIALGYILPYRFPRALAISFAPERDELDTYPPQTLRAWRGLGVRFYRSARAYLHPNFRLTRRAAGALAVLAAERLFTRVCPQQGLKLSREDYDGSFAPVPDEGEPVRPGEVYRIGESGPFFRLAVRR